jgi:hypothetical protein
LRKGDSSLARHCHEHPTARRAVIERDVFVTSQLKAATVFTKGFNAAKTRALTSSLSATELTYSCFNWNCANNGAIFSSELLGVRREIDVVVALFFLT